MHIQVINFNLKGMSHQEFSQLCDELASTFASTPGLYSKVWLADRSTNTYGGVYTWQDHQAMEKFTQSDLFNTVATHPNFENITSKDFGVLEGPTQVTGGLVAEPVV